MNIEKFKELVQNWIAGDGEVSAAQLHAFRRTCGKRADLMQARVVAEVVLENSTKAKKKKVKTEYT